MMSCKLGHSSVALGENRVVLWWLNWQSLRHTHDLGIDLNHRELTPFIDPIAQGG